VQPYQRILVVVDGTPAGQAALEEALRFAHAHQGVVKALVVEGRLPRGAATIGEVEDAKQHQDTMYEVFGRLAVDQATEWGVEVQVELRSGSLVDSTLAAAREWQPDLLVVGRRRPPLPVRIVRSRIVRIVDDVGCPVMVVRPPRKLKPSREP
jgi:nucleotide-binding universal stress UspA family protein